MSLSRRLAKIEAEARAADERHWVEVFRRRGAEPDLAQRLAVAMARAYRECPPVPTSGGRVDVGPTLMRLGVITGIDSAAILKEAGRIQRATWADD